jgi:hypothetical protein
VAQKHDGITRPPDMLEYGINIEFDKDGILNTRRGYQFVDLRETVNRADDDDVFCAVTTYRDELVVFSYDYVEALGSKDAQLRGEDALVYRGPSNRGAAKLEHVSTSELSAVIRPGFDTFEVTDGNTFAGHEQADVASLTADGIFYRCYVYLNRIDWRIDAVCFATQAQGQTTLIFRNVVRQLSDVLLTAQAELAVPKIIAVGTTFVVHWVEGSEFLVEGGPWDGFREASVHRSTMDMEAFDASAYDGWNYRSSLGLHVYHLYDVCPVIGSDTDFMLVRYVDNDDGHIEVQRFGGFGILDDGLPSGWSEDIDRVIAPRVLAVYAHEADDDVVVSYQPAGIEADEDQLWSAHLDAEDGGGFVEVRTFVDFPESQFCQVGHARVVTTEGVRVAVVTEALLETVLAAASDPDFMPVGFIRHVAYRLIDPTNVARIGNEHWTANLAMCSRPFAYASGAAAGGVSHDLYVVLSHKSCAATEALPEHLQSEIEDEDEDAEQATAMPAQGSWREASIYVCNLDLAMWESEESGATVRARPVATITSVGIPDARPSLDFSPSEIFGPTKRHNHISYASGAPPFGPDIKTRTIAIGIFARMGAARYADIAVYEPQNAGIHGLRFYLEDPWTIYRDDTDPEQPVDNYFGAYSRPMYQSVEAGNALLIAGGTPSLYDGNAVVELGFPWCEIVVTDATDSEADWPADLTLLGTYSWYVVPTWRDAAGQFHRGPPSNIITRTLTGTDALMILYVRAITTSMKDNAAHYPLASKINFEVFRTTNGGSIFYRVYGGPPGEFDGVNNPTFPTLMTPVNDPTTHIVAVYDGCSDANLELQGFAPYTIGPGGFLELTPQVVPALSSLVVWQGHLWGVDMLDPAMLWYSDQILPEFGSDFYRAPEFNDRNTFRIDGIGEVVALKPMANELIVFTRAGIFAIQGQGNDGVGEGANLQISALHEGTGCIDPRSIVLGPPGIFFQSHKGYYLLNRGKQLDYITAGANIDADIREAGNVHAATLLEDRHQIRIVCNGRPVVTYTTTFVVNNALDALGDYTITLTDVGAPGEIAAFESGNDTEDLEVVTDLAADINALLADRTTQVHRYIQSSGVVGGDLIVVWQPGVTPMYTTTAPAPASLTGTDAANLEVQPRVLICDYRAMQWSRADLHSADETERLNDCVSGCAWRGVDGATAHVVLQQGGLRIERGPRDPLAYSDELAFGAEVGIPIDLQLTPFHPWGFAGYGRIRSIGIQTRKPLASEFSVDLQYYTRGDFDDPDEIDEDITVEAVSPAYVRVRPRVQKAAIGVRIYQGSGLIQRENISVVGLVFEVGMKKGPRRVANSQIGA